MLDKLTGKPVHLVIHFIACLAIVVGLPWSKIPLSLGTMLLFANLLLKADSVRWIGMAVHRLELEYELRWT